MKITPYAPVSLLLPCFEFLLGSGAEREESRNTPSHQHAPYDFVLSTARPPTAHSYATTAAPSVSGSYHHILHPLTAWASTSLHPYSPLVAFSPARMGLGLPSQREDCDMRVPAGMRTDAWEPRGLLQEGRKIDVF